MAHITFSTMIFFLDNNLVLNTILLQRNNLITPAVTSIEILVKYNRSNRGKQRCVL